MAAVAIGAYVHNPIISTDRLAHQFLEDAYKAEVSALLPHASTILAFVENTPTLCTCASYEWVRSDETTKWRHLKTIPRRLEYGPHKR